MCLAYLCIHSESFEEKLTFRFIRKKGPVQYWRNIWWKKYIRIYMLAMGHSDSCNISLMWDTDGIPIFKSSKFSVWPFYCIINELGFVERTKTWFLQAFGLVSQTLNHFSLNYCVTFFTKKWSTCSVFWIPWTFHMQSLYHCRDLWFTCKSITVQ